MKKNQIVLKDKIMKETNYLLSSKVNEQKLRRAILQLKKGEVVKKSIKELITRKNKRPITGQIKTEL